MFLEATYCQINVRADLCRRLSIVQKFKSTLQQLQGFGALRRARVDSE